MEFKSPLSIDDLEMIGRAFKDPEWFNRLPWEYKYTTKLVDLVKEAMDEPGGKGYLREETREKTRQAALNCFTAIALRRRAIAEHPVAGRALRITLQNAFSRTTRFQVGIKDARSGKHDRRNPAQPEGS